jgi:O-antigen/teichoic acid export membrane protein
VSSAPRLSAHTTTTAERNTWLWTAFARSVRDNVMGEIVVQAIRIGGMVILARALTPHDFGWFRILMIVSAFVMLVNEAGIPDALIQRKDLRPEHQTTAWWMCIGIALAACGGLYAIAPILANLMKMPELRQGIRLLCIPIFIEGTAVTANARLRREMRFGALAFADVMAEAAFLITALVMLWHGYPRWALAGALAARFAGHAIGVLIADRRLPLGLPRLDAARDLSLFAVTVLGGRISDMISANADFVLVGRLLGSTSLGYYSMAWDLLRFVPDRVYKVAGRVTLPAFCLLQDQPEQLAKAYLNFCDYLARIVLPIVTCAAIAAPELITTIYGAKWAPAAVPMRLLAIGLLLAGLRVGIGSVYYSKGRPSLDIYLHNARLALIIVTVVSLASSGLAAVSAGMSTVESIISIVGQWMALALLGVGMGELITASMPGVWLTVMCAGAVVAGKLLADQAGVHGATTLLFMAIPAAIVYCWRESSTALQMFSGAFGRGRSAPVVPIIVEETN